MEGWREGSLPVSSKMTRQGWWRQSVFGDVGAAESGLAGFVREGPEKAAAEAEKNQVREQKVDILPCV